MLFKCLSKCNSNILHAFVYLSNCIYFSLSSYSIWKFFSILIYLTMLNCENKSLNTRKSDKCAKNINNNKCSNFDFNLCFLFFSFFFEICFHCYEHVWNLDWNFILSTKIHMKTNVTWRTFLFLTFDFHVNICFLNQIFSLCYLFSKHAFYIIFDFHRDERCKFHIRYRKRSTNKKKQNRSTRDDCTFSTRIFQSTMTMTKSFSRFQHSKSLVQN